MRTGRNIIIITKIYAQVSIRTLGEIRVRYSVHCQGFYLYGIFARRGQLAVDAAADLAVFRHDGNFFLYPHGGIGIYPSRRVKARNPLIRPSAHAK